MSAEKLFQGLGKGLGDVYGEQSQNQRQQVQLTAEESMQKARLLEEDNLARFHEMGEDARQARQLSTEKQLRDLDNAAAERRLTEQMNQAQKQFEASFGMKVGEDFEQRVLTAQDLANKQLNDFQLRIMSNPMAMMQYQQLGTLQQQAAAETDPQKRAALQSQIDSNPITKQYMQARQQAITSIMAVATNPTEYASLAVRFGGMQPQQAQILARAKYQGLPSTSPGEGAKPAPTPTATTAPAAAPTPAASATAPAAASPAPTTAPAQGPAKPIADAGQIVTPDMLAAARSNVLGPGNVQPMIGAGPAFTGTAKPGNDIVPAGA